MKAKHKILKEIIDDVLWMAIRYAHGRHTYAPGIIRDAVKKLKELYPDFKLIKDITIEPPEVTEERLYGCGWTMKTDWLDDLFEEKNA